MQEITQLMNLHWNYNKTQYSMYILISNPMLHKNWPKIFELILEFYKAGTIEP
jgi:hypothetical protein